MNFVQPPHRGHPRGAAAAAHGRPLLGLGHLGPWGLAAAALLGAGPGRAEEPKLTGDLGLGASHVRAYVRNANDRNDALPYLNLEYGRLFARIDTLGVQVLPLGYGHIEAVVQVRNDGYQRPDLPRRADSTPVGVGSLQITPVGAFGLQVLHDFGPSGGNLVQARYLAELSLGRVHIYPELGAEYLDRRYTGHYYGDSAQPAAPAGQLGRAALNPYVGAMVETQLAPHWFANLYLRHRVFDAHATEHTLVDARRTTDLLAAVSYRY